MSKPTDREQVVIAVSELIEAKIAELSAARDRANANHAHVEMYHLREVISTLRELNSSVLPLARAVDLSDPLEVRE